MQKAEVMYINFSMHIYQVSNKSFSFLNARVIICMIWLCSEHCYSRCFRTLLWCVAFAVNSLCCLLMISMLHIVEALFGFHVYFNANNNTSIL